LRLDKGDIVKRRPLDGTLVLDLSRVLAGPWATQTLADLGARVIKIEHPVRGDDTRHWGPPWHSMDGHSESAYFLSANRGKESVALDFKDPRGQSVVRELAKRADIFIENYRVGGLASYSLDYESIQKINPAIVYCSISGFGQTGPYANKPGYDFIVQAMSGLMSITGDSHPVKTGVAVSDLFAGLYATIGILAAYAQAKETGKGDHIDISLLEAQLATLANQSLNYLVSEKSPGLSGNAHPNIVPYQVFETANHSIVIAVGNDRQFEALCRVIGSPELSADPRFVTNPERVRNRDALVPLVANAISEHDAAYWLEALDQNGIPAGPVNTIGAAFADRQVLDREVVEELHRADSGPVPTVRSPLRFRDSNVKSDRAPPVLGNSTLAVLDEIGLSREKISALIAAGVVAANPTP